MMALLRSEKLMEIMSTQEASAKPSKILSKLFPSFRIRRENGQSSKSKNGRQIWTKPGKNTTHSSWNDEEQHPELVKRIACVVISLPPPSFYFHSMYEKKNQGSIWSVLLIETFFIFQSTFLTRLIKLMLWCIPLAKEEIVTCDMEMCSTILNCDITEEDYSTTTHHCNARFISTWGNHAVRTRKGSNSAKEDYSCTVN